MSGSVKAQILEAEERLRLAMLHPDVIAIDELLEANCWHLNSFLQLTWAK